MSSKLPAVSLHPFSVIIISGSLNLSLNQTKRLRNPKGVIFNHGDPDLCKIYVVFQQSTSQLTKTTYPYQDGS